MIDLPALFGDQGRFRNAFVDGLANMLRRHDSLGVFILVLANATYDVQIHAHLHDALRARFEQLAARLRRTLADGRPLPDAPDDVLVFLKLMAVGFEQLRMTEFRRVGAYQLQFNPLRAYRPPRMSGQAVTQLYQAFGTQGFHFNKPFLQQEIFWEGDLFGHACRLLYNKFPFAELHGLLVIDADDNKPQWLTEHDHLLAWQIAAVLGRGLPGIGLGYNAYGAYASVNHQHFQTYIKSGGEFPVESPHWRHNGGSELYPADCRRCDDPSDAWQKVVALHHDNVSYNLLYRPNRMYLMPRRFQGDYHHAPWTGGFAWSELSGAVTTFNREDFESLDGAAIAAELAKLRLT